MFKAWKKRQKARNIIKAVNSRLKNLRLLGRAIRVIIDHSYMKELTPKFGVDPSTRLDSILDEQLAIELEIIECVDHSIWLCDARLCQIARFLSLQKRAEVAGLAMRLKHSWAILENDPRTYRYDSTSDFTALELLVSIIEESHSAAT